MSRLSRAHRAAVQAPRTGATTCRTAGRSEVGLEAQLIHPDGDRIVPARLLALELLGGEPPEPEALQQLEVAAAAGIESVAADLVARSIG